MTLMNLPRVLVVAILLGAPGLSAAAQTLDVYFIDTEGGRRR